MSSRLRPARVVVAFLFSLGLLGGTWRVSRARSFQFFGEIYDRAETADKVVALTFDDGPGPDNTPAVLELLDRFGARATFFMIGRNIERQPVLARQVLARGHEAGSHSYSHLRMVFKTPTFVRSEIERTDALLRSVGATGDILFRAPYGKKLLVLPWVLSQMNKKNILWDAEADDTRTQDPRRLTENVLSRVRAGSIILFHDGGSKKPGTLKALESVLTALSAQGYSFVTVSELLSRAR